MPPGSKALRAPAVAVGLLLVAACAVGRVPLPPPAPPVIDPELRQRGGMLFLDPRLSGDSSRSCATCHPGGSSDGLVWIDGARAEPGAPGGRSTTSLRGAWQTPPYYWDGSSPTLREAIERMLAVEMRGGALPELDRRALETYVLSLAPFDRGRIAADGSPREPNTLRQRRGFALFTGKAKCAECHPPPAYTTRLREDVGTGGVIDVPTLRGLADSAPYGHDARWAEMEAAVRAMLLAGEVQLGDLELEYLLEYLKLL